MGPNTYNQQPPANIPDAGNPVADNGQAPPMQPNTQNQQPAYPGGYVPNAPVGSQQPAQFAQAGGQQPSGQTTTVPISPKTNPNSTQNTLQIAEIRDGIVVMNDGSFRSVVMTQSINFDLMSPEEKESVEYGYQGFLNQLYFPIQVFVRSRKVDLRPYLEKLDKIRQEHDNMLLALLMEDYLGFIENLSMQANIMDKQFYVVIPYFPTTDVQRAITQSKNFFSGLKGLFKNTETHVTINEVDLNLAKDELRNRVQAILSGLHQTGVQGLPLDTQELIELYYDTYNPDTATHQPLKNFDDVGAPMVTKGEGMAPQPSMDRTLL